MQRSVKPQRLCHVPRCVVAYSVDWAPAIHRTCIVRHSPNRSSSHNQPHMREAHSSVSSVELPCRATAICASPSSRSAAAFKLPCNTRHMHHTQTHIASAAMLRSIRCKLHQTHLSCCSAQLRLRQCRMRRSSLGCMGAAAQCS